MPERTPLRIANITPSISSHAGGMQSSIIGLCESLSKKKGVQAQIFSGRDTGQLSEPEAELTLLKTIGLGNASVMIGLQDKLNYFKPTIVIQHGIWGLFTLQVTRYCKKKNIPYLITPHGMLDPYILSRHAWKKNLALALYQSRNLCECAGFRALNETEASHIRPFANDKRIIVLPNALNEAPIKTLEGVPRKQDQFCFLGRIDQKKSVIEMIYGWIIAKERSGSNPAIRLKIAGWGGDTQYVNAVVQLCRARHDIDYVGPLFGAEKWNLLAESGALILASKGEGLPTSVLEAWQSGTLPIITDECNFPASVFYGAAIRTTTDPESIANSILEYLALSSDRRNQMQDEGSRELKKYNWTDISDQFLLELRKIIGSAQVTPS